MWKRFWILTSILWVAVYAFALTTKGPRAPDEVLFGMLLLYPALALILFFGARFVTTGSLRRRKEA